MVYHLFPSSVPAPVREDVKGSRGYYTRAQLSEAIKAVLKKNMTVAQASVRFKIPRATLQKRVTLCREEHREAQRIKCILDLRAKAGEFQMGESNRDDEATPTTSGISHNLEPVKQEEDENVSRLPLFSEEPYAQGVAEECEITTAPTTSTSDLPKAKRIVSKAPSLASDTQPRSTRLGRREFVERAAALNEQLPTSHRMNIPSINRIVIKDPCGNVLKQYVVGERRAMTSSSVGTLPLDNPMTSSFGSLPRRTSMTSSFGSLPPGNPMTSSFEEDELEEEEMWEAAPNISLHQPLSDEEDDNVDVE